MKLAWLAGVLFVTGCAHSIAFKVVDSASGKPIAGVLTSWRQDSYDLLLGQYQFGPTNLPASGEDGTIVVHGILKGKVNKFIFSRSEYVTVYGGYYLGGIFTRYRNGDFSISEHTNSISGWNGFIMEQPQTGISPTNGFLIIPMRQTPN